MEWPPFSPDLNPIDYVWKRLKKIHSQQHPYIKDLPVVKASLAEVLPENIDFYSVKFPEKSSREHALKDSSSCSSC